MQHCIYMKDACNIATQKQGILDNFPANVWYEEHVQTKEKGKH